MTLHVHSTGRVEAYDGKPKNYRWLSMWATNCKTLVSIPGEANQMYESDGNLWLPQRMTEEVVDPSCSDGAKSNEPVFYMQCICIL
ncbi:hypothetical protein DPMN_038883 [Dreissena polymorpha]|uniref:Uncharacterized protein n=1 Tax=Dreissena polymorpha TaxID=45954 RepID=A0A9D4MF14_DREPO|nr:hypothetical protein DPMN_038883 [Dreissena polymorpha]